MSDFNLTNLPRDHLIQVVRQGFYGSIGSDGMAKVRLDTK